MNKNRVISLTFISLVVIIIFSSVAFTSNSGKAGKTGSPGENACNECHSTNALNSGGGSITITSPDLINWSYVPGVTYNIQVKVKKSGVGKFGFGFEALLPSGANAGIISTASSTNAKSLAATVLGNSRNNAVHKQPNHFGTDSVTFSFQWTAPPSGTGNVNFYAAGNATNTSNSTAGDFIYTTNQLVTELSTASINSAFKNKVLMLSPNPCSNFLQISLPQQLENSNTLFQLFDLKGNIIFSQFFEGSSIHVSLIQESAKIADGIYVAQLQNGNWYHHEKVMVTN